MKLSLLDYVQQILASMDSDEVNSISDTGEARQVAQIVRTAYFNIISRANLPEHKQIFNLVASGDDESPVLMYRPENVSKIEWIKYNTSDPVVLDEPEFNYVNIVPIQQFLDRIHRFSPDDDDTFVFNLNNFQFYFKNNQQPTYCTILEDYYIIFDAFDEDLESTLQGSKTLAYGQVIPTFEMTDTFVPNIDEQQVPLLLNEAKALAFLELKQITHDLATLESRRQWRSLQKGKYLKNPSDFDNLPDFGRR